MPKKKQETRLKKVEQVKDRKQSDGNFVAFSNKSATTYEPYSQVSIKRIYEMVRSFLWVKAAVNTIVDEVVKYPLYSANRNNKLDSFLEYPSDREPLMLIRKKYLKDMLLWGNGACVIEYKSDEPSGLVTVPGYTLRLTDDNPPKYKLKEINGKGFLQKDGNDIVLKNKQVMHFQIDADSDTTLARSPLETIFADMGVGIETISKLNQFIKRGLYLPCFVSFKQGQNVGSKEVGEFVEQINAMIDEAARFFGINKEATVTSLPHVSLEEMMKLDFHTGIKVATAYKVPPFMLNLVNDIGSLNAREQKARFLENVVQPILLLESYIYTLQLVRKGFKNSQTKITAGEIGTRLNFDRAKIANLLTSNDQGVLTHDEARKMFFNLEPKQQEDPLTED